MARERRIRSGQHLAGRLMGLVGAWIGFWGGRGAIRCLRIVGASALLLVHAGSLQAAEHVTALGRLEPGDGVVHIAGPSGGSGVIAELRVEEGDYVERDQLLAILDRHRVVKAEVEQGRAELARADQQLERLSGLSHLSAGSRAKAEDADADRRVAAAGLAAAQARLTLQEIRAPMDGQVLEIHARAGEVIRGAGVLALGETRRMVAVAEVYETDVAGVKKGGAARVTSPALPAAVSGRVVRVGLSIGRQDVLDTDPVAKIDSRVVEVRILLEPETAELAALVSRLTYLQVEVEIAP